MHFDCRKVPVNFDFVHAHAVNMKEFLAGVDYDQVVVDV
jgi:hypothetical protein